MHEFIRGLVSMITLIVLRPSVPMPDIFGRLTLVQERSGTDPVRPYIRGKIEPIFREPSPVRCQVNGSSEISIERH